MGTKRTTRVSATVSIGTLVLVAFGAAALCEAGQIQSSTLSLRHEKGVVSTITNRLTGEKYTLDDAMTAFTPGVGIFQGVGKGDRDARPDEAEVRHDADVQGSEIVLKQSATTDKGGCQSVRFVVAALDLGKVELLIPGHDGVLIDGNANVSSAYYHYPSRWGTPLVVVQGKKGGVMIWALDKRRPFLCLRMQRAGDGVQCEFTTEADAPWEKQTHVESPLWHFEAYEGNWLVAAEKNRARMQEAFSLTPRAKREPAWARKIRSVVTVVGKAPSDESLRALASRVPPETVLLYFVDWRTHSYDVMYPDYEATPEAVDFIRRAHKLGFRVMVHGNLVGISPRYPEIERFRDVLLRSPRTHKQVGWFLDRDCPNQICCLNLASPKARRLLIDAFVKAHQQCGFDALHLDFPVILNADCGRVEGSNTIQGAEVYLCELQQALPDMAFGMEGLADYTLACSFAQVIGTITNPREQFGSCHPVASSLFSPFCQRYMHLAIPEATGEQLPAYLDWQYVSDRLGALPSLRLTHGFDPDSPGVSFALSQMRFWGERQPEPDYSCDLSPSEKWRALGKPLFAWKLSDGCHAATIDAKDGTHLFAESEEGEVESIWHVARRTSTVATRRQVAGGWCAYDAEHIFGLDPQTSYLLTEQGRDPKAFHLRSASTPVLLNAGGSNPVRDILKLESAAKKQSTDLCAVSPHRVGIVIRGKEMPLGKGGQWSVTQHAVCGGVSVQGISAHPPFRIEADEEGAITFAEYTLTVPDKPEVALEFAVGLRDFPPDEAERDRKGPLSDGVTFTVLVNAEEAYKKHWAKRAWDEARVDLSPYRGKEVRLRFTTHPGPKDDTGWDWAIWGKPRVAVVEGSTVADLHIVLLQRPRTVLVADAQGDRVVEGEGARLRVALPATVVYLHDKEETSPIDTQATGASFTAGKYACGGVTKEGYFAHPPYRGEAKAALAFGEFAVDLPRSAAESSAQKPLRLVYSIGIEDGAKNTDGVLFRIEIDEKGKDRQVIAEDHCRETKWKACEVNLSGYRGRKVVLRFSTDAGATAHYDWACWAEPRIVAGERLVADLLKVEPHKTGITLGGDFQAVAAGTDLLRTKFTANVLAGGQMMSKAVGGSGSVAERLGRRAVLAEPPRQGETHLEWLLFLPSEPLRLRFAARIQPCGSKSYGDCNFRVEVNGRCHWTRYIRWWEPEDWVEGRVDLSAYAGKPVLLSLIIDPAGKSYWDNAMWAEPRLERLEER